MLRNSEYREVLAGILHFFEGVRHEHVSWVAMPNHVHILCKLLGDMTTGKAIASWKKESARGINKLLGVQGSLWEKDYRDRMIRDREHLHRCIRYIRRNPAKAHLREGEFTLFENSYAKDVL